MMLVYDGKVSLISFLLGAGIFLLGAATWQMDVLQWVFLLGGYIALTNLIIMVVYKRHIYQVASRGCLIGLAFGLGLLLSISESDYRLLGWYITSLAFFHWSEFMTTALSNPRNLTLESYLLDHSREYHIAAVASVVEFLVEAYCFPSLKRPGVLCAVGLVVVVGGETLRKLSMLTAGANFNHYVQHVKHEDHILITSGIYGWSRHPAYVGWFYWSVGSQLMIFNPICLIGYTMATWKFFKERVMAEEIALLNFFGEDYMDYQAKVPTRLPFIRGYSH